MDPKKLALVFIVVIVIVAFVVGLILYIRKDDFLSKVEDLISNGEYKKALNLILKRIDLHPHDFALKYYLGQTYEGLKEFDKAALYYQKAAIGATEAVQQPLKLEIFYKLAEIYRRQGKLKEAVGYYLLVLDKNPENSRALFHVGEIYYELHNYDKAIGALQKLLKIEPAHIRSHYILSEIFQKKKNYTHAAFHLEYILSSESLGDKNFLNRVRMELGLVYLEMKNYVKCENILQSLLTDKSYGSEALITVLKALIQSRQTDKALALIEIQQKDYQNDKMYELIYFKGKAFYADHLYYQAIMSWKEAYKLNPDYQDLKNIRQSYQFIMDHPKLEVIFSSDDNKLEEWINHLTHSKGVGRIVKTQKYWIFRLGEFVYSIYRVPFPVPVSELIEMQDKISGTLQSTSAFTLLSLYGINKVESESFNYKKLTLITENRFVEMVEKGSLSE